MKICIYAFGATEKVPVRGVTYSYGMPWGAKMHDVNFEIHAEPLWENDNALAHQLKYAQFLTAVPNRLVLHENHPADHFVKGERFPIDIVLAMPELADGYITNSISYMLLYAYIHGASEIALRGVDGYDHSDFQEILFERPNIAYIIGVLQARCMQFDIPKQSDFGPIRFLRHLKTPYLGEPTMKRWTLEYFLGRARGYGENLRNNPPRGDLCTRPWTNPSRYGTDLLETASAFEKDYAEAVLRELDAKLYVSPTGDM